ncbi:MAG: TIGR01777 family protein [bacterium]|nr:TIGR01777 family protein [bacterium]
MRVFIAGGTGLVGRHLIHKLVERGDEVVCLSRDIHYAATILPTEVKLIEGHPVIPGDWQEIPRTCDTVINLAGAPVFDGFWTQGRKRDIRRSRLSSTFNLVESVEDCEHALTFINASAIGIYGEGGSNALSEVSQPGEGFLARLACEWEHTARQAEAGNVRVVMMRLGIVLATDGGALPKMVKHFNMGLGGKLGNGRQYFPWIHIKDLVEAILFTISCEDIAGPVNFSVPTPPTQGEFTKSLAAALGKSAHFPVPRMVLKIIMGERAHALLQSQRAVPNVLKVNGFRFKLDELDDAMADLF